MTLRHGPSREGQDSAMMADQLLEQAASVVRERRQQYGPPAEHFAQVARRWSLTIGTTVPPEVVLLCQLDLKLVRLAHDPGHRDSLVDLSGYSLLLHELMSDASAKLPAEIAEAADCQGRKAAVTNAPPRSAEGQKERRAT